MRLAASMVYASGRNEDESELAQQHQRRQEDAGLWVVLDRMRTGELTITGLSWPCYYVGERRAWPGAVEIAKRGNQSAKYSVH
jgi:hypothetical protein